MTYMRRSFLYLMLALNGCVQLPEMDNTTKYIDFNQSPQRLPAQSPKSFGLKVLTPTALPSLNSGRIAFYQTDKNVLTMTHVAGIIWKDPLPLLVQQHIVESLMDSGLFHIVGEVKDKFDATFTLQTHVNHFEVIQHMVSPYIHVDITHILSSGNDKKCIYQKSFKIQVLLTDLTMQNTTQAFDQAFQEYQNQMIVWISKHI